MGQAATLGKCYKPSESLVASCWTKPELLSPSRVRPLLCGVEPHFVEMADDVGRIEASSLVEVWQAGAQKKLGSLSLEDIEVMEVTVDCYLDAKKLEYTSRVNYVDFMSFLLDGTEGHTNDGSAASKLRQAVARNPQQFHEVVMEFAKGLEESSGGHGIISEADILDHSRADRTCVSLAEFTQLLEELLPNARDQLRDPCSAGMGCPEDLASHIFFVLGVPSEGKLDLYNGLACILDRRQTPVELILYDISHGASRIFSQALLGRQFEAIYHSSALVFGTEFWYGGQVFENEPPINPQTFGPPLFESMEHLQLKPSLYNRSMRTVHLGSTLVTLSELREFLQTDMKPKYRPSNYDVMTHNCNHFTDDVVRFLTGKGIPETIRHLPENVMNTSGAKMLRPILNRWLCSFQARPLIAMQDYDPLLHAADDPNKVIEDNDEQLANWEETVVQAAKDGAARDSTIDLGFFDPTECTRLTRKSVRRSAVLREESGRLIRPKSREEVMFSYVDKNTAGRKEVRRSAVRRLVDGSFVHAKLV